MPRSPSPAGKTLVVTYFYRARPSSYEPSPDSKKYVHVAVSIPVPVLAGEHLPSVNWAVLHSVYSSLPFHVTPHVKYKVVQNMSKHTLCTLRFRTAHLKNCSRTLYQRKRAGRNCYLDALTRVGYNKIVCRMKIISGNWKHSYK